MHFKSSINFPFIRRVTSNWRSKVGYNDQPNTLSHSNDSRMFSQQRLIRLAKRMETEQSPLKYINVYFLHGLSVRCPFGVHSVSIDIRQMFHSIECTNNNGRDYFLSSSICSVSVRCPFGVRSVSVRCPLTFGKCFVPFHAQTTTVETIFCPVLSVIWIQ